MKSDPADVMCFVERVARLAAAGHDLKQELCELVQQVVGMNFQEEAHFCVQSQILTHPELPGSMPF